jgi:hypothetical protein
MTTENKEYELRLTVETTCTADDKYSAKAVLAKHGREATISGGGVDITVNSVHVSEKKPKRENAAK